MRLLRLNPIKRHRLPSPSTLRPSSTILPLRQFISWFSSTSTEVPPTPNISTIPIPEKPFFITTPIFYVNAAPHIGHLYSLTLTDVIKRWQVLSGKNVIMATGTDEHGMKIQQAAEQAKQAPQEFCDSASEVFKNLARKANISNNHFIRTTDPVHKDAVQYAWHILQSQDYIYLKKHSGWYSVSDEAFYPPSAIQTTIDPNTGNKITVSIETGKPVELTTEENYHFRLSAFQDRLIELYSKPFSNDPNQLQILPRSRQEWVLQQLQAGPLQDLSISRPRERLTWGIPVPHDPSQTIYVWLDALINYLTVAHYPFVPGLEHQHGWPADIHVIGKDILRFHCIYWPAFLMALDLPLPRRILTHAHWTLGKKKMSKSDGNGVNPFFAIDRFGADALRYYLVGQGGLSDDADYSNEEVVEKYKKSLQDGIGNVLGRVTGKTFSVDKAVRFTFSSNMNLTPHPPPTPTAPGITPHDAIIPTFTPPPHWPHLETVDNQQLYTLLSTPQSVITRMDPLSPYLNPRKALRTLMSLITDTNKYISEKTPWKMATDSPEQLVTLYLCAEALRIVGVLGWAWMPEKMNELLDALGVEGKEAGAERKMEGGRGAQGGLMKDVTPGGRPGKRGIEYARLCADDSYAVGVGGKMGKRPGMLFPPLECTE